MHSGQQAGLIQAFLPERAASLAPSRTTKETSDSGLPASSSASGLASTSDSFGKEESSLSNSACTSTSLAKSTLMT